MAIKNILEVPEDLPPAHLFLDDVEEIVGIFREYVAPRIGGKSRNREELSYAVGSRRCDGVDDLKKIGGRTTEFELKYSVCQELDQEGNPRMRSSDAATLRVSRYGSWLHFWGVPDSDRWAVYGRVNATVGRRKRRLRAVVEQLGEYGAPVAFYLIMGSWVIIAIVVGKLKLLHLLNRGIALLMVAAYTILAAYGMFNLFRHSIVDLRYSHDSSGLRVTISQAWPQILAAIVGAVIYALVSSYFSK